MKYLAAATALALALLSVVTARADVEIDWNAPANCPSEEDVLARLVELVGPSLDSVELRARATIEPVDGRFRLTLHVLDGSVDRARVIVSDTCADLAGAAAVALVFLLQEAESSESGDAPKPAATSAEPDVPAPPPRSDLEPMDVDDPIDALPDGAWGSGLPSPVWLIQAPVAAVDVGTLPEPTLLLGAGGGFRVRAVRIVLRGELGVPQQLASGVAGVEARIDRARGTFLGCRAWSLGRFSASPCLVLGLEYFRARGAGGALAPTSESSFGFAPGTEVDVHLGLADWIGVFAGVSARIELYRPRIVADRLGDLRQIGQFSFGTVLGAEWIP